MGRVKAHVHSEKMGSANARGDSCDGQIVKASLRMSARSLACANKCQ